MAVFEILKYPDPRLTRIAAPVTPADYAALRRFIDDLAETMYVAHGLGLAAPQVGRLIRVFVVELAAGPVGFVNPTIEYTSAERSDFSEGCLSMPGVTEHLGRSAVVSVSRIDIVTGARVTESFTGMEAVAVQHENDHLDGVLIRDRLSPLKRRLMDREYAKRRR